MYSDFKAYSDFKTQQIYEGADFWEFVSGEAAKETYLAEYYLGPAGLRDKVKVSEDIIVSEEAQILKSAPDFCFTLYSTYVLGHWLCRI